MQTWNFIFFFWKSCNRMLGQKCKERYKISSNLPDLRTICKNYSAIVYYFLPSLFSLSVFKGFQFIFIIYTCEIIPQMSSSWYISQLVCRHVIKHRNIPIISALIYCELCMYINAFLCIIHRQIISHVSASNINLN